MSTFNDIADKLDGLSKQAAQRDRIKGEHHQALFDEHLFKCRARLLVPCVTETKSTYQSIMREQQAKRLTQLRAEHLTQLLLAQLEAIQRELATENIRHNEIKHSSYYRKPISELYQDLSQHQEWEIRLQDLVQQKTHQVDSLQQFAACKSATRPLNSRTTTRTLPSCKVKNRKANHL